MTAPRLRTAAIVCVAALVGLLFGLPHLLIPALLPDPSRYTPLVVTDVSFLTVDETYSYGPRVREVMDERWAVTDPIVYEHKSRWPFWFPVEQVLLGAMGRWLGSAPRVYVISDFLFPPLDFLLLAKFLALVTGSTALALLGALAILAGGGQNSLLLLVDLGRAVMGGSSERLAALVRPLEFSRLFTPELTFIPFIGGLVALYLALTRASVRWAVVAGVCLALLIPSYLYYWMFFAAGVGLLWLEAAARGDGPRVKVLTAALGLGFLLALPYWISYARFMGLPEALEVTTRFGAERGRYVVWPGVKDLVLMAATALLWWRTREEPFRFLLAFWVGLIACRNVQLVTGYMVQTVHWGYRVGYIWQTITIVALLAAIPRLAAKAGLVDSLKNSGLWIRRLALAGVPLLLVSIAGYQVTLSRNTAHAFALPPGFAEALDWINRETPRDSVIVTPSFETNMLIPVYTHANVFMPNGNLSLAPTEELIERLLITYRLFSVPGDYLRASLRDDPERLAAFGRNRDRFARSRPELLEQHGLWYFFHRLRWPEERIRSVADRYERFTLDPKQPFGRYRADYVWLSPLEKLKGSADLSALPFLVWVYENQGVKIARVVKPRAEARSLTNR